MKQPSLFKSLPPGQTVGAKAEGNQQCIDEDAVSVGMNSGLLLKLA
jgi:hypothetical protein